MGSCFRTLRASWEAVKRETEAVSIEHTETHTALLEAANRVAEFTDKQKHARKEVSLGVVTVFSLVSALVKHSKCS